MPAADEHIFTGLLSTAVSIGVAWGIVQARVESLLKRQDKLEQEQARMEDHFVTHKHLEAVVTPLQKVAEEIQRDIKKLIMMVSKASDGPSQTRF